MESIVQPSAGAGVMSVDEREKTVQLDEITGLLRDVIVLLAAGAWCTVQQAAEDAAMIATTVVATTT